MTDTEINADATLDAGAPKRRRSILWTAVVIGCALCALLALLATRDSAADRLADSPLLGHPAPAFTAFDLDGDQVSLDDFAGDYVVLNFFASWCVPCEREHPELIEFTETDGRAEVVAVIFDDDVDNARRFFDRRGGDWPVVDDPEGKIALDFGVRGPPESFLISPDGYVLSRIVGEVSAEGLRRLVSAAEERA